MNYFKNDFYECYSVNLFEMVKFIFTFFYKYFVIYKYNFINYRL